MNDALLTAIKASQFADQDKARDNAAAQEILFETYLALVGFIERSGLNLPATSRARRVA